MEMTARRMQRFSVFKIIQNLAFFVFVSSNAERYYPGFHVVDPETGNTVLKSVDGTFDPKVRLLVQHVNESQIEACAIINPCGNGGMCQHVPPDQYFCACTPEFTGPHCEYPAGNWAPECPPDFCDGHCVVVDNVEAQKRVGDTKNDELSKLASESSNRGWIASIFINPIRIICLKPPASPNDCPKNICKKPSNTACLCEGIVATCDLFSCAAYSKCEYDAFQRPVCNCDEIVRYSRGAELAYDDHCENIQVTGGPCEAICEALDPVVDQARVNAWKKCIDPKETIDWKKVDFKACPGNCNYQIKEMPMKNSASKNDSLFLFYDCELSRKRRRHPRVKSSISANSEPMSSLRYMNFNPADAPDLDDSPLNIDAISDIAEDEFPCECKNKGWCEGAITWLGARRCVCPHGFFGPVCEFKDTCAIEKPCGNATCVSVMRSRSEVGYACECKFGQDFRVDKLANGSTTIGCYEPMLSNGSTCPCKNGGICKECQNEGFHLERILSRFSKTNVTRTIPCTTAEKLRGVQCICATGWQGEFCQNPLGCTGNKCANNATCIPGHGDRGYTCRCRLGFAGKLCENRTECNAEAQKSCVFGDCVLSNDTEDGFLCKCEEGYAGSTCQLDLREQSDFFEDNKSWFYPLVVFVLLTVFLVLKITVDKNMKREEILLMKQKAPQAAENVPDEMVSQDVADPLHVGPTDSKTADAPVDGKQ